MADKEDKDRKSNKRSIDKKTDYGRADCIQEAKADRIAETAFAYCAGEKGRYTLEDYYALPDERRVELIDGSFYDMAAPTIAHQRAGFYICRQIDEFIRRKGGKCISLTSPVDVQLDCDDDTVVQPDVLVVCDRDKILNRCIYGAPDLIVEILSPSTRQKDSVVKLEKYRNAGVREYWMVDLDRKRVLVYEFEKRDHAVIYGMDQEIPAGFFDGECKVYFAEFYEENSYFLFSQRNEP